MSQRQDHIDHLNTLTIKYGKRVLMLLRADYMKVAKVIIETQNVNAPIQINQRRYAYELYKLFLTIGIDKTIVDHNNLIKRKAEGDTLIYEWLLFLKGYADRSLGERITKITETTRQEIAKIIEKGLIDGLGYRDIAKNVRQESTGDFNQSRSLLIARTEGNNAINAGAFIAARSSGLLMEKRWLHAGHAKRENRPEHVRLWRQKDAIGINDYFTIRGKKGQIINMLFPGDPAGGAEQNCNCRCIATYKPVRDANDNVISTGRRITEPTVVQRTTRTALIESLLREFIETVVEARVINPIT